MYVYASVSVSDLYCMARAFIRLQGQSAAQSSNPIWINVHRSRYLDCDLFQAFPTLALAHSYQIDLSTFSPPQPSSGEAQHSMGI